MPVESHRNPSSNSGFKMLSFAMGLRKSGISTFDANLKAIAVVITFVLE